jgi:dipeptidyl aminopeptidase/acylaminoacyl peptidase
LNVVIKQGMLLFAAIVLVVLDTAATDIIPIGKFLSRPVLWSPLISPDGEKISYVAVHLDAPNLWVSPVGDFASARPVTSVTGQGVTTSNVAGTVTYRWTADSKRLLYLQDKRGDERWHLMSVAVDTGEVLDLTPVQHAQARLVATSLNKPEHALVEINDRRPDRHDLYLVNLSNGERRLVMRNDRFVGFFADNFLSPRLAVAASADGGFDIYRLIEDTWQAFIHFAQEDTSALIRAVEQGAWNFTADNKGFRIYDSRGRDTWAIVEIDIESGERTVLAENPRVDIDSALYDPANGDLQAYSANWTRRQWFVVDAALEIDFQALAGVAAGSVKISSRSADSNRWLVEFESSNASPELYLHDRETQKTTHLATLIPAINGLNLPVTKPVVSMSRDGLNLVSYLVLPLDSDRDVDGIPDSPLPMIVYVHGGPNDERAVYRFHPYLQWLANRGYAVLDVNYRGSPGFGKAFLNAQNLEWGNKMHLDVVDQVEWAITQGIADKDKVGIFGGSFGGYEVLVAMSKTPDLFACGVDLAGPSEMESFIKIWWENFIPMHNMAYKSIVLGDPETEKGRAALRKSSPLYFAHQAKNPVLVIQGDQDSRVPTAQAEMIVQKFVEADVPVTYVLYPEEGHGVVRPGNRKLFFAMVEVFFGQCLGGQSNPLEPEYAGAKARVPQGIGLIHGLQEVMNNVDSRPGLIPLQLGPD